MVGRVKNLLFISIVFFGSLIFFNSLGYFNPNFDKGFLIDKKEVFDGIFKWALYSHIISTPIILISGSINIFYRLELRNNLFHKILGRIYVFSIFIFGFPSGFILSFFAFGDFLGKLNFFILSFLLIIFTFLAFFYAIRKNYTKHNQFMHRSFILVISAIFLRLFSFISIYFFDYAGKEAYILISWSSWVPILLYYEINRCRNIKLVNKSKL